MSNKLIVIVIVIIFFVIGVFFISLIEVLVSEHHIAIFLSDTLNI